MLKIESITKKYRNVTVLDNVSFGIEAGDICGLAGVNGAGKSTLMRIICSLVTPDSGSIIIDGQPTRPDCTAAGIGYMIDAPCFYPMVTGRNNLRIFRPLYRGLSDGQIDAALETVGLKNHANKAYRDYSMGMKQRLYFAYCFIARPKLFILDEPFNGVDPISMSQLEDVIAKLAKEGAAVLLSGHYLSELQKFANKIAVLDGGVLVHFDEINPDTDLNKLFKEKAVLTGEAQ